MLAPLRSAGIRRADGPVQVTADVDNMPISSITQVLLRLSALNWFVSGLVQLATTIFSLRGDSFSVLQLAAPAIIFLAGIICWILAPFLSRQFTKGADSAVSLEGVTLSSLYATSFVGLGLWFALANVAQVFNWIHFYVSYSSKVQGMTDSGPGSFYNLSQAALTFVAGVILVATAQTWARKLTKRSEQTSPVNRHPFGTSGMPPANPASRAGSTPEASGDS